MGSTVNINGEIRIDPPVPWLDIRHSEYVRQPDRKPWEYPHDLMLRVVEQPIDTAEGTLIRRWADAIVSAEHDEARAYHIEEEIDGIVREVGRGRTFTGRFEMTCRDYMSQWRIKVVDGTAVRFDPEIVWPEASS
ncbi:MAG TPA: DUF6205 family protein [Candidatus Limnocylindrales bacterium]|nr:DUF6205 family protein [Candidatus Limnocylindrales bacterium]